MSGLNQDLKWYVVHTYSGFEGKAREALVDRIKKFHFENMFGEILVPTEERTQVVKGKKRSVTRKFFPGYILVQMLLNDKTWHLVKQTPKITGFIGGNLNPLPVSETEIQVIRDQMEGKISTASLEAAYHEGDSVRVVEGPFSNFNGVVEEVKPDKQKIKVLVSIFGRSTPVELNFSQVEKS
ncbi:MAG: transcription termination/antitermination protein NusG [Deltaproteobacteria bacterium]|nr:transcription termination/antitermination protein NusG [Deltaproteobacteria bacterium]